MIKFDRDISIRKKDPNLPLYVLKFNQCDQKASAYDQQMPQFYAKKTSGTARLRTPTAT